MNLSYWEIKTWLTNVDFTVIGSGIVGLNCAIALKQQYPKANVLILEKGTLPEGASTKNAGFACFGSLSELIEDLNHHTEEEVLDLVKQRIDGLQLLRKSLGDKHIDFFQHGGYELFLKSDEQLYELSRSKEEKINKLLHPIFKDAVFSMKENTFGFKNIHKKYSYNKFEGQLDTGKMMRALIDKVHHLGIKILNNIAVKDYQESYDHVTVHTNQFDLSCSKLVIATNGFASTLIKEDIKPARAQVLITKPINNLQIKGTFHLDEGYYYFRNIDNRLLFGGGRNLDFKTEETTIFGQTELVQNKLEELLHQVILPQTPFEIEHRWSGIMGVGNKKKPIVKQVSDHTYCGIRLGGMGVAIGSKIGLDLARLVE
ncbi:MAG: FAD-binding oxidoreductase [Winogradskyella sp.]|nr:FAD-binding oxidoreductase [Winogradskyella sp.]